MRSSSPEATPARTASVDDGVFGVVLLLVLAIVAAVALINIAIWLPIVRRLHRIADEITLELEAAGERIVRGPERASYRGATATYGRVKGVGVIALTETR